MAQVRLKTDGTIHLRKSILEDLSRILDAVGAACMSNETWYVTISVNQSCRLGVKIRPRRAKKTWMHLSSDERRLHDSIIALLIVYFDSYEPSFQDALAGECKTLH